MTHVFPGLLGGILLMWFCAASSTPQPPLPQDCLVTGAQNRIDFGTRTRSGLTINSRGKLTPGQRNINISVVCRYPQNMIMSIAGNATGRQFAWGGGAAVRIKIQDTRLDSKPVLLNRLEGNYHSLSDGVTELSLNPGDYFTVSIGGGEVTGKQLTFTLTAEPEIDESRVTFNRPYNGQSLLTLRLE